ncbi:MAG TPA: NlpC/P60 family protein [Miltoncostaeaceae bacterium]|nr:NlpC/P60 family protein [Miltoncostaeaceae bacterium]
MAGCPPAPRRRRALGWGLAIALLAPVPLGPAVASASTATELAQARAKIERTSAELMAARSAADGTGGAERDTLEAIERRLQQEKADLVRLERGLTARRASEAADAAADAADESTPAATPDAGRQDGPVVRLAEAPGGSAVAGSATPSLSPALQRQDEVVPQVQGDAAAQASRIDGYLASKFSPLTGLGAVFVTESQAVGMDPRFLVAIAGSETSFGTYGPSQAIHNPFGMGPGINYPSWAAGIRAAAQNLGGPLYKGSGLVTVVAIRNRWAPAGAANDPSGLNSNWVRNVGIYLAELGGDPSASVFTGVAVPVTAGAPAAATGPTAPLPVYAPPTPVLGQSGKGPSAAESALAVLGAPGAATGADPDAGFSPAGLIRWAYAEHGVEVPGGLAAQSTAGRGIAPKDLDSGDVIMFADEDGTLTGAGLYVGGGQFVHSEGEGGGVRLGSLYDAYYAESYAGARRF